MRKLINISLKLFGAILILISGSSIGWIIAAQYKNRIRDLQELQLAFNLFNTEISYTRTLLPIALQKTAVGTEYPVSILFNSSADKLNKEKEKSFFEIWKRVLTENKGINYLLEEDLKILEEWGQQIGCSGLEEQKKINKLTLKRLEQAEKKAQEIADKKVKLSRYSGILISLMIIILFY